MSEDNIDSDPPEDSISDIPPEESVEILEDGDVTYEIDDEGFEESVLNFIEHNNSVFCGKFHPTENLVVTGGQNDVAYVWNCETGDIIKRIQHEDSVNNASFNKNGQYLATADMSGELQVFKVSNGFKRIWNSSINDIIWIKWHDSENVLLVGTVIGLIYMWNIAGNLIRTLPSSGLRCEAAEIDKTGRMLLVGYSNGEVKLWDLVNSIAVVEISKSHPLVHKENVVSVSCHPNKDLYITGSEDGTILLLNNKNAIQQFNQNGGSIEVVLFSPFNNFDIAVTGTLKGQITIWDTKAQRIRHICKAENFEIRGITCLKWLNEDIIAAGTVTGEILIIAVLSGEIVTRIKAHSDSIYEIDFKKSKNLILSTSEDFTAKIFKYDI